MSAKSDTNPNALSVMHDFHCDLRPGCACARRAALFHLQGIDVASLRADHETATSPRIAGPERLEAQARLIHTVPALADALENANSLAVFLAIELEAASSRVGVVIPAAVDGAS